MAWTWYLLQVLTAILGLFLTILGLPGLWLIILVAGGLALLGASGTVSLAGWLILLALTGAGEAAETLAAGAAARRAGAGRAGGWGAILGGMIGGIVLSLLLPVPIIGSLAGVCLGAFIGAAWMETLAGQPARIAWNIGVSAARGRLLGLVLKLLFGFAQLIALLWLAWPTKR